MTRRLRISIFYTRAPYFRPLRPVCNQHSKSRIIPLLTWLRCTLQPTVRRYIILILIVQAICHGDCSAFHRACDDVHVAASVHALLHRVRQHGDDIANLVRIPPGYAVV